MGLATQASMPQIGITCDDCYFRREALCALADGPCPTFRPCAEDQAPEGSQPRLIMAPAEPRPVAV